MQKQKANKRETETNQEIQTKKNKHTTNTTNEKKKQVKRIAKTSNLIRIKALELKIAKKM